MHSQAGVFLRPICLLGMLWLVSGITRLQAAPPPGPSEYEIKAAFVFNFAKFVDWPETSFATSAAPFLIGVSSQDSVFSTFEKTLQGKVVRGHPILVLNLKTKEQVGKCHIVFLSEVEGRQTNQWLESLARTPALTVGESNGFASRGGIINFFLLDNQVRFEINRRAAEKAGLKVSSQLLSLARIVADGP